MNSHSVEPKKKCTHNTLTHISIRINCARHAHPVYNLNLPSLAIKLTSPLPAYPHHSSYSTNFAYLPERIAIFRARARYSSIIGASSHSVNFCGATLRLRVALTKMASVCLQAFLSISRLLLRVYILAKVYTQSVPHKRRRRRQTAR